MAKDTKKEKTENQNTHPNAIGMKEGLSYMAGDAGNLFVLTYISSYLKVFFTDVLRIASNKITTLFLMTRLWDAINDPLWGYIVAKRKPRKNGKYRPYLLTVSVPLGISCIVCFIDYSSLNASLVLLLAYITYTAFGMLYTGMNIPYGSLASVITDDPKGRTLLSTMRSVGSGVGGGVVSLVAPMIVYKKLVRDDGSKYQITDAKGMFIFAIAMGILSILFYFICYKSGVEKVKSEENPKVDMKATYKGLLTSRPFLAVAAAGILISGQLQFNSFNQYLFKNYFENTTLSIIGTICNYLPMAICVLFNTKLVQRFGKKELCGNTSIIAAVAAVVLAVIANNKGIVASFGGKFPAWLFMLFMFLIGVGYTFVSLTCWAVVMDVIDYQEYKTGIRSESAIYAVYTFCRKLGQTLADTGGMKLLAWSGYDGTLNGKPIADCGYVPGVGEKLMVLCTVIPAVVYVLVFVLMKFIYPLSKDKLEPVYAYIRSARDEAAE